MLEKICYCFNSVCGLGAWVSKSWLAMQETCKKVSATITSDDFFHRLKKPENIGRVREILQLPFGKQMLGLE